jgi:UDP-N-acetylglucosamine 2-epimerase (non-hydrolysing)
MKILWMTWKDRSNPNAGGAELINEIIISRLAQEGHEVIILTAGFDKCEQITIEKNIQIIRLGNRYTVYWLAYQYYKKNLKNWADIVIDEVNTIPFFCKYYVREKNILFIHQLCRQIWFYQIYFPINLIGYLVEPIYLWILNSQFVITISESTKKDLIRFGFASKNIEIIPEAIAINPIQDLKGLDKFNTPTLLSLGAIRSMKRTLDQIKAFEIAKRKIPNLQLKIAGKPMGSYGNLFLEKTFKNKSSASNIEYIGPISEKQKIELLRRSHFILVTSIKEGWGLIVTEANSQGTPAIGYKVDGICDSIKNNITGFLCENSSPSEMAKKIVKEFANQENYKKMQFNAWEWSKNFTPNNCYDGFLRAIKNFTKANNQATIYFYIGTEAELIKLLPAIENCIVKKSKIIIICSGQNDLRKSTLLTNAIQKHCIFLFKNPIWFPFSGFAFRALWFLFWSLAAFYKTLAYLAKQKIFYRKNNSNTLIVHGDTISTVIGAMTAKILGYKVMHVESGLSSGKLLNPFPEELSRRIVMRLADVLFCPTLVAMSFAEKLSKKEKIMTGGNSMWDMLQFGLKNLPDRKIDPFFLLVIHRQETLANPKLFFKILEEVKKNQPKNTSCNFIMHLPTKDFLIANNKLKELSAWQNWTLIDRVPFYEFIFLLKNALFVLTDGGTNQEECYYLGSPCFLLREYTERQEGLGSNVYLDQNYIDKIGWFMENYSNFKKESIVYSQSPSSIISERISLECEQK